MSGSGSGTPATGVSGASTGTPVDPVTVVEPISLDDAGFNLHAADDGNSPPTYAEAALILRLITAARQACEEEMELSLVVKNLEVTQDSFYPEPIELPYGPVRSIVSVTYIDEDGVDVVLAADQYRLSTSGRMALLWPAYNVSWPSALYQSDSVRVVYAAGYLTPSLVPETIKQAMHLYIAHWFTNREAVDLDNLAQLPLGARFLISKYRHGLGV